MLVPNGAGVATWLARHSRQATAGALPHSALYNGGVPVLRQGACRARAGLEGLSASTEQTRITRRTGGRDSVEAFGQHVPRRRRPRLLATFPRTTPFTRNASRGGGNLRAAIEQPSAQEPAGRSAPKWGTSRKGNKTTCFHVGDIEEHSQQESHSQKLSLR